MSELSKQMASALKIESDYFNLPNLLTDDGYPQQEILEALERIENSVESIDLDSVSDLYDIKKSVESMSESVSEIETSVGRMSASVSEIEDSMETMTASVKEIQDLVESMNNNDNELDY